MPAEVAGVPLHPLVVHAVVVLLPLAATGVLLMAVVPSWRGRYGSLVAVTALVGTALVPVATMSGEELEETVPATDALERHTELGESILAGAVPLLVVAFLLWWIGRRADRDRDVPRWLTTVVVVLALVVGLGALVQVVLVGHSGAVAVWE